MPSNIVNLLKNKYLLEQRIFEIKNTKQPTNAKNQLLSKMSAVLESIEFELASQDKGSDLHLDFEDHEVNMAQSDLYRLSKKSLMLHELMQQMGDQQQLEGWVQAKITKAADYVDSVWNYLSYQMQFPNDYEMQEATIPPATATTLGQQQNSASSRPEATTASPGMVKMTKLDANKKPIGTPIMVKSNDIAAKQSQGFAVIGEGSMKKGRVLPDLTADEPSFDHSQEYLNRVKREKDRKTKANINRDLGKSFGTDKKGNTYYKWPKETLPKKKATESASAGATASGSIASNAIGFANGGIGMKKRKVQEENVAEVGDRVMVVRGDGEGESGYVTKIHYNPDTGKHQSYTIRYGAEALAKVSAYAVQKMKEDFGGGIVKKNNKEDGKENVAEAKGLKKRVRVVKTGETGTIGEVQHGLFKGAPKTFIVDLDKGGNVRATSAELRLIKDQQVAEGSTLRMSQKIKEEFKNSYSVGDKVTTPQGAGTIVAMNKNIKKVKVKLDNKDKFNDNTFSYATGDLRHISETALRNISNRKIKSI